MRGHVSRGCITKLSTIALGLMVYLSAGCKAEGAGGGGGRGDGLSGAAESASLQGARAKATAKVLTLGAYTTPREAYGDGVLPVYRRLREQIGKPEVEIRESYLASGAQARAIAAGFEADIAALSMEPDIALLEKAGLVAAGWNDGKVGGTVTKSVVVIGVRKGNPLGIREWADLTKPGVKVLTPNVRTSGGAKWNIVAIFGAAMRGHAGVPRGGVNATERLTAEILANVRGMDRSGRDSMLSFERGIGDAIITYENEMLVGQKRGLDYEYVVPASTVVIENPVAVVTKYATAHGVLDEAREFTSFLFTPEVQRIFSRHGLRPVDETVASETKASFAAVRDTFSARDLGGWDAIETELFAKGALYDRALEAAHKRAPE